MILILIISFFALYEESEAGVIETKNLKEIKPANKANLTPTNQYQKEEKNSEENSKEDSNINKEEENSKIDLPPQSIESSKEPIQSVDSLIPQSTKDIIKFISDQFEYYKDKNGISKKMIDDIESLPSHVINHLTLAKIIIKVKKNKKNKLIKK